MADGTQLNVRPLFGNRGYFLGLPRERFGPCNNNSSTYYQYSLMILPAVSLLPMF